MKKTKIMRIRMTSEQYEKIQYEARMHGYRYVSEYMRHLALNVTLDMEQKVNALYFKLVK